MVIAENRNGSIAPINSPIITIGSNRLITLSPVTAAYEANRARAVSAAEPMAKPFPIAAVVLPTESSLSVISLTS